MFFKRLSRSRGNSYVSDDYEKITPPDTAGGQRPPSSYNPHGTVKREVDDPHSATIDAKEAENMYQPRAGDSAYPSKETAFSSRGSSGAPGAPVPMPNGISPRGGAPRRGSYGDMGSPNGPPPQSAGGMVSKPNEAAPDLLTRAFNEALRPYTEKIEQLEEQLATMQEYLQQQEQMRIDIFAWIDKRGLRPDVPPAIAKSLDTTPQAADALNAQLDRKITIVNFDLHRLQDDLNDSISSAHFASAMAKFLPDIQRLSSLRTGSRYAYELIIKLVGNLNGHGGLEAGVEDDELVAEDRRARQSFYSQMDEELVEVISRRMDEREDWAIAKEVKRLERNGAYLKNLGIESYFPKSLNLMRQETDFAGGRGGGAHVPGGSPPRYQ